MGVEKKITITGADSIQIDYEFAGGAFTPPGAFRIDPDNPDRDYVKSRKISEVIVHDREGVLLAARGVGANPARVDIATEEDPIIIADYAEGDDSRVYVQYSRRGFRVRAGNLYHPEVNMLEVRINDVPVAGWDGKGTVEILYREKPPAASAQSF